MRGLFLGWGVMRPAFFSIRQIVEFAGTWRFSVARAWELDHQDRGNGRPGPNRKIVCAFGLGIIGASSETLGPSAEHGELTRVPIIEARKSAHA